MVRLTLKKAERAFRQAEVEQTRQPREAYSADATSDLSLVIPNVLAHPSRPQIKVK
jgi:hypothetical protein